MTRHDERTPTLTPDDARLLDDLVDQGFDADAVRAADPEEARRLRSVRQVVRRLDDYALPELGPDEEAAILDRALSHIDWYESDRAERYRLPLHSWRLANLVSVAAAVLLVASIALNLFAPPDGAAPGGAELGATTTSDAFAGVEGRTGAAAMEAIRNLFGASDPDAPAPQPAWIIWGPGRTMLAWGTAEEIEPLRRPGDFAMRVMVYSVNRGGMDEYISHDKGVVPLRPARLTPAPAPFAVY